MGVQLNIKDAETVELARDLAAKLGKTVTETVKTALEEKRAKREADIEAGVREVMKIGKEAAALWPDRMKDMTSEQIVGELYDDRGLPV